MTKKPTDKDSLTVQKAEAVGRSLDLVVLRLVGWKFSKSPEDGKDYWVALLGDDGLVHVCEANATRGAFGGWSNQDTWEDFDGAIIAWKKMRKPWFPQNAEGQPSAERR